VNLTKKKFLSASLNIIKPYGSQHTPVITPRRWPLARPKCVRIKTTLCTQVGNLAAITRLLQFNEN
jgi:hypothetical protein